MWLIILGDSVYTFFQFYWLPLDGDMSHLIMPDQWHEQLMKDPLGFQALFFHERYYGPNRFFIMWPFSKYFKTVPLLLQSFLSPIESVYVACAIAKLTIQLLLVWLLAFYASGTGNLRESRFVVCAAIIIPLFQNNGFYTTMGIIDQSITYAFFYAFPMIFLLLLFLPFYRQFILKNQTHIGLLTRIALFLISIPLALSGPLISPIILLVTSLTLFSFWLSNLKKTTGHFFVRCIKAVSMIDTFTLCFFLYLSIINIYSLYIGSYNNENFAETIPLSERFYALPLGLQRMFTLNIGFAMLLTVVVISLLNILAVNKETVKRRTLTVLKFSSILILLYRLLLTLGGYRFYRPFIIRYDTLLPVTLTLIFLLTTFALQLLTESDSTIKKVYATWLVSVLIVFTITDHPFTNSNRCEKNALKKMAASSEQVIEFNKDCHIMEWSEITDPEKSRTNAEMIHYWRITDQVRLYYQK